MAGRDVASWPLLPGRRLGGDLRQERLEADAELKRGLSRALAVHVGSRAQQERLAGIRSLAAAEVGRHPFLWAHRLRAIARPGAGGTSTASVQRPSAKLVTGAETDAGRERLAL